MVLGDSYADPGGDIEHGAYICVCFLFLCSTKNGADDVDFGGNVDQCAQR